MKLDQKVVLLVEKYFGMFGIENYGGGGGERRKR
jgi:hypothetical protein